MAQRCRLTDTELSAGDVPRLMDFVEEMAEELLSWRREDQARMHNRVRDVLATYKDIPPANYACRTATLEIIREERGQQSVIATAKSDDEAMNIVYALNWTTANHPEET